MSINLVTINSPLALCFLFLVCGGLGIRQGEAFRKGGLEIHSGGVVKDGADYKFSVS